jgi:hypothetical protein
MIEGKEQVRLNRAAEIYDIPQRTLRDYALLKKIKAHKIGSRWYVEPAEMERLKKEGLLNG